VQSCHLQQNGQEATIVSGSIASAEFGLFYLFPFRQSKSSYSVGIGMSTDVFAATLQLVDALSRFNQELIPAIELIEIFCEHDCIPQSL
jgi:hypothetical protein